MAATEMALLVPLLLTLMFGGFEAGHFVWTQHKLTEAVRDGARFASRFPIDRICNGTAVKNDASATDAISTIKLLTRTGQIVNPATDDDCTGSGGPKPKICGWKDDEIRIECGPFVNTGIYQNSDYGPSVIKVEAFNVKYPSFFQSLGIIDPDFDMVLSAASSAAVIGI